MLPSMGSCATVGMALCGATNTKVSQECSKEPSARDASWTVRLSDMPSAVA